MAEFDVIHRYFQQAESISWDDSEPAQSDSVRGVILGSGDDGAILRVPAGHDLVVSLDTLVAGCHFPHDCSAADIAYKALAVNISDLLAMAAEPRWLTLGLTLPNINDHWLSEFSKELFIALAEYQVNLVGGDLSKGPLSLSVEAHGIVPAGQAVLRSGACVGDKIFLSGCVGDAGLALAHWRGDIVLSEAYRDTIMASWHRPNLPMALLPYLRLYATAAIDISDGLAADLGHILSKSAVGAQLNLSDLPLSEALQASLNESQAWQLALTAGDDYQLCFTVPESKVALLLAEPEIAGTLTLVGTIEAEPGLRLYNRQGDAVCLEQSGWEHFNDRLAQL